MKEDARGISFGGGNRGLATIVPFKNENFFDHANKGLSLNRSLRLRERQRAQQGLRDIKNFDAWKYYSPELQSQWNQLLEDTKKGIDPIEMKKRALELGQLSKSSLQMEDEYKGALSSYKQNKAINENAAEWFLDKYHSSPTIDNLKDRQTEAVNHMGFLDEEGGSKYVNKTEAFKTVVEGAFKDFVKEKFQSDAVRERIGLGLFQLNQEQLDAEFKRFSRFNRDTKQIEVKDPELLIQEGVLDVFMDDPFTQRIIEDEASAISNGNPTDEIRAQVLRGYLVPMSTGSVTDRTNVKTVREAVDFKSRREGQSSQTAQDWLERARGGDEEAWNHIQGAKIGNGTVMNVQKVAPDVIRLNMRKVDSYGESTFTNQDIYIGEGATNEELLRFYRAAPKKGIPFGVGDEVDPPTIEDPNKQNRASRYRSMYDNE